MGIARKYQCVVARSTRPSLTSLILGKIAEAGGVLLDSFFPAKYPEARLWRVILGLDSSYEFKRSTFSSILAQLQAQGLVERRGGAERGLWRLTAKGKERVGRRQGVSAPKSDGRKRLVCFDIPERERAKRRWLRGELLALSYESLQKSVWLGQCPLPQEFVASLDELDLRRRVHIFLVASEGTLSS